MSTNQPSHKLLAITDRGTGQSAKSFFTPVGKAWPNQQGGFSIVLDALPVSGRLLMVAEDTDEKPDRAPRITADEE